MAPTVPPLGKKFTTYTKTQEEVTDGRMKHKVHTVIKEFELNNI
jgi:hypothetical protein